MIKATWVVMGGRQDETAHCTRCGEGLRLGLPIQVEVFLAATKAFEKAHSGCSDIDYKEPVPTSPQEWLAGRDTGLSSITLCAALAGVGSPRNAGGDIPHDAADLGRCIRFLQLFPHLRSGLPRVPEKFPNWGPLIKEWKRIEAMYDKKAWQDLNELLRQIYNL